MLRTIFISLFILFSAEFVSAETVYIDSLDLNKCLSGWGKTQSRKSVSGGPISIGGQKFDRGVGIHPANTGEKKAEIRIALPLAGGRFTAQTGINDSRSKRGCAEFFVLVDGETVWQSGLMKGGDTAKSCEVSFTEKNQLLQLIVSAGQDYNDDHTDWGDAKLEFQNGRRNVETQRSLINAPLIPDRSDEYAYTAGQLKTGIPEKRAKQALRPESVFLPSDQSPVDVVFRRTKALLAHLQTLPNAPALEKETAALADLEPFIIKAGTEEEKRKLFAEIAALRDNIALQNPLLDFNDILFIKRHYCPEPEKEGNHMVDQFFGFHAVPGGGLFILQNAFVPDKRTVKNVTANSAVENECRLKGEKLDGSHWGFLSPELSFDSRKILFAAAETSEKRHSYQWTAGNCYHLFEINVDGTHLKQLTDGQWNDIDPCYLPGGRIAFISERRGGYGRCHGRPCPGYTLHSMLPDGRDIVTLSPHETNEWSPVVDHHGMIVYTRWDYVDRGFNNAHHPWTTTPDGRDPRAIQGNYSEKERERPHFETSLQPIPQSPKFAATAQGHHSQYFGSVVLLDPNVPDDEEGGEPMAPLRRITPEQPFPEVENRAHKDSQNYGQPFPIGASEDFYLVVYDPYSGMGKGHENNYGIYLLDSFGNRTLLYRDPEISCQNPIPLKPRPVPAAVAHQTLTGLPPGTATQIPAAELPKTGTAGVVNVHLTNRPFPAGTKIKELRIVQILPKTTPVNNVPRIGYGDETGARKVLGTVPVEPDGSVRFELPVNVPVYFQVLDENGVAVQWMRSATYIKPGETLTCLGCHEGRHHGTANPASYPAAFRKPASVIKPEADGSNPFSYPRLVQPVLDKHCVSCHEKEAETGKTFRLGRTVVKYQPAKSGREGEFFESYAKLEPYVFMLRNVPTSGVPLCSWSPARTFPKEFGANKSPLWHLLQKGHYGVVLSQPEKRALALWMDNNADFYGAFELDTLAAQREGKIVLPKLE
ncbi:MAG: NPCBM/NEW2 domain-containing protein [Planctomycetaceae bacterium]|jgi:hypothetical protein|nr:NPCBM/NEW2 domain-containing protein [Planctomycetaceae bacterium]